MASQNNSKKKSFVYFPFFVNMWRCGFPHFLNTPKAHSSLAHKTDIDAVKVIHYIDDSSELTVTRCVMRN